MCIFAERKVHGCMLPYGTARAIPTSDMLCVMPCLASGNSQLLTPDYQQRLDKQCTSGCPELSLTSACKAEMVAMKCNTRIFVWRAITHMLEINLNKLQLKMQGSYTLHRAIGSICLHGSAIRAFLI